MRPEQDLLMEENVAEERKLSKYTYKLVLIILKYTPPILAIVDLLHTILSYYDIQADLLSFIGGVSIFSLLFIYTTSYAFQFCEKHRIPLHYVVCSNIIGLYDTYVGIPCSDKQLLCIYLILTGIFLLLYVTNNKTIIKTDN